ncbi:MAG: outer membrane protein OmpA-like peptidoglycan-associated protein [Mariniblastus sp.]|jgi:outer membrane protein OmpA-like peptidoglycan-associated protein
MYLVRVTLTSEVSGMARRVVLSAFCIAAVTTLAGCVDSASIQKNTVSAQSWVAAGSNASSFGVQNAGFTVINFEFDSDELTAEAVKKLDAQAAWIESNPNIRFGVTGHTDLVGDAEYNMELGMRRAERVVAALMNAGVNERRLVAQVSQGELEPVVDTDNREAANRRTTTEFLEYISNQNSTDRAEKRDRESPTYYSVADKLSPETETVDDRMDETIDPGEPETKSFEDERSDDEISDDQDVDDQVNDDPIASETSDESAEPEGSKTRKTDNSDANGKGGNKHNRKDKDVKVAHEASDEPEGSKTEKTDNSDANGKGGNKHKRDDKDQKNAHETAENKKSAESDFQ